MNFGCCPADVFRKPVRCLRRNVRGSGTDLRLRLCGRGSFELYGGSVMEQPCAGEGQHHAVFVGGGDDMVIPDGAAGLGNVGHAGLSGPLHIVAEGEEGIAANSDAGLRGDPRLLSSGVRTSGRTLNVFCHTPSASTSSYSSEV